MKHFFKRVNRGIVLGVVLLIGLAVFIWQDESNFQKETPAIEKTVTSYLDTLSKINTFNTSLQKIGATMTTEQQTAKLQEFTKTIDQYWAESNVQNRATKPELLMQMKEMVSQNSKGNGYIQKFTVRVNGTPTVKKTGPSNATARVDYTIVMEYAGSPYYFDGDFMTSVSRFSGKADSAETKKDATLKRYNMGQNSSFELEKIGGTWKIIATLGGSSSSGEPVIIE
jgi:hypothetical protein